MAIALVASAKFTGTLSGNGTSGAANASGANLGVVVLGYYGGNATVITSVTDTNSNTWTRRIHVITSTTSFGLDVWDCQNGTFTNGMTVTVNTSGGSPAFSFGVAYYSGVAASSPIDASNSVGGSSHTSTINTGSTGTLSQTGDLLVAGLVITDGQTGVPGAITIDNSLTIEVQNAWVFNTNEGFALADLVYSSTTAINPLWSGLNGSAENAAAIVAYKAAAGGGASVKRLSALGVG